MKDSLKALLEWISELTGLQESVSTTLSALLMALTVWGLQSLIQAQVKRYRNLRTARDLKPQFDYQMVDRATRYFIPTHYQNASPTRQEEPGFTHKYIARQPLIPFFIKTAFNERKDSERFYLILADSGMGKTTFMINLYLRYHSFWNRRRKHRMHLFRLAHPDTLSDIKAIKKEAARNTILLLDALDEDRNIVSNDPNVTAAEAFTRRVDQIIEATRSFYQVLITCRTQYFPGQEADPYELKIKRPDGKGFYILNKLYLSPFTDQEVRRYLNNKFGYLPFLNRKKKRRAASIVGQARHLVMRPMMLSYIDYLLEEEGKFATNYAIYQVLVQKWLEREAEKRKGLRDRTAFIENLNKVSQQTAVAIYEKWSDNNELFLTKKEALDIALENNIELLPEEVTGQSLLTCDGPGNWKFAHKSILEFFLVKELIDRPHFVAKFDFTGMDQARQFFIEKLPVEIVFVKGSTYQLKEVDQTEIKWELPDYWIAKQLVTQEEYVRVTGKSNPSHFQSGPNYPVDSVDWGDAINFCDCLNQKMGYRPVYNEKGQFLDAQGEVTDDLNQVRGFRLPTELEWEFAARGGIHSKGFEYSGSNDIKLVAWYDGNSKGKTHPVGQLQPNELGIYDMSGNVWEWCYDWYRNRPSSLGLYGPDTGTARVVRGGSWLLNAHYCRAAFRLDDDPGFRAHYQGFRLVFVP